MFLISIIDTQTFNLTLTFNVIQKLWYKLFTFNFWIFI